LPAWSRDLDSRRAAMLRTADAVTDERLMLAELLTREQGKPFTEALREVDRFALWLRHYASLDQSPRVIRETDDRSIVIVARPLGVVAAITPWNFPISLLGWKLAPALAAGNSLVVRPSLSTPLTTLRLGVSRRAPRGASVGTKDRIYRQCGDGSRDHAHSRSGPQAHHARARRQ